MMTPEEITEMDNRLVQIAGHPDVNAADARYALAAAITVLAEVKRLQFELAQVATAWRMTNEGQ